MFVVATFLLVVIGPVVFWWWFFRHQDRAEPEPRRLLVKSLFLGMGVALLSMAIEGTVMAIVFPGKEQDVFEIIATASLVSMAITLFGSSVEELLKFLAIKEFIYEKKEFNQIADGIIYAITVALGFVMIENSLYFYDLYVSETTGGFLIASAFRGIATALLHITTAGIIGYAFGRMKFTTGHNRKIVLKALGVAILLHFAFNTLILFSQGVFLAFFIVFLALLYLISALKKRETKLVWKLTSHKDL